MPIAVTQDWAEGGNNTQTYDAVNELMGVADDLPDGLIFHTAGTLENGAFRIFDVWESREHYQRFEKDRLMPAIMEVLGAAAADAPPPTMAIYDLHSLFKG